ncbi:FAD-dependent oxidoreductase [soil metagenome]
MDPEFVILGAGLAGCTLAWQLKWRNVPVRLVDRCDTVTASKVAAGLITPITGKRFALDPHFESQFAAAVAFYRRVEAETGERFFHQPGAVRFFRSADEREHFDAKRGLLAKHVADAQPAIPEGVVAPFGAMAMPYASRLDVAAYLTVSRQILNCHDGTFDTSTTATGIDCTGIGAFREQRLTSTLFQPAKGEILTLRIPGLKESRILHHGIWLAPLGDELYRCGATYSWDELDDVPTVAGRDELVTKLSAFLKLPFEVISHDAATRPITVDRQPILMQVSDRHWAFNGLGSKGALLAPSTAAMMVSFLVSGRP